jgi:hypothetical protein
MAGAALDLYLHGCPLVQGTTPSLPQAQDRQGARPRNSRQAASVADEVIE